MHHLFAHLQCLVESGAFELGQLLRGDTCVPAGEDQVGHVAARIGGDVDEVLPVGARRAACKVQIERRGGVAGAYARCLAESKRC